MADLLKILDSHVAAALHSLAGSDIPTLLTRTQNARFGDYQCNAAMPLAKRLKQKPREIAEKIVSAIDVVEFCKKVEIAGPGFINFTLRADYIAKTLDAVATSPSLGVGRAAPLRVVVDFSAPNIAKQMHVGHLRTTIMGDVICRLLEFAGHQVIRQNHIGDYGRPIAMVLCDLAGSGIDLASPEGLPQIEQAYKRATEQDRDDAGFRRRVDQRLAVLQKAAAGGDEDDEYDQLCEGTLSACQRIYDRLGVTLDRSHVRGERAYAAALPTIVEALRDKGLLTEDDGAQCVFLEGFKTKDGSPLPLIVQKRDETYLYATTDLAALDYRINKLGVDQIVYVTDARQKLHFQMIFDCAAKMGWADSVNLRHVTFGSILGSDGKPFKTRQGESVKLEALLDEAEQRATEVVKQKSDDSETPLSEDQKQRIALAVGMGAIKYADLANNRTSDYVFSFDKMLALTGNTAPYLQYAYARINSIFRKGGIAPPDGGPFELIDDAERALGLQLVRLPEAIDGAMLDFRPNVLTTYLYDLATAFTTFYEQCPVLKSEEPVRSHRLALCALTARTIKQGLALLGIDVIGQM